MLWFMLAGCRGVSLGFVLLAPADIEIEQAHARLIRYRLTDCDGTTEQEWVGRRIDLRNSRTDQIRDRRWCRIDLDFKDAPVLGPQLGWSGWTANGTDFSIALSPGTTTLQQSFGGDGEDLVLMLDLDALIQAREIDDAAAQLKNDAISFDTVSEWSQEHAPKLPEALYVVPRREAAADPDWGNVTVQISADDQSSGCGSTDTAIDWGETDFRDSGFVSDTGEYLSSSSSSGCQCTGASVKDSRADTAQPASSEDSNSGCVGSRDSGDSGAAVLWARRGGLATLLVLFSLKRRRI